jgi:2-polyprenyl-3-methyl-5-hydroxy-6-metoxy-1,4-benzoquinol methylase
MGRGMNLYSIFPAFASRSNVAEIMDDFDSDEPMLHRTLAQFRTVNLLCTGRNRLLRELVIGAAKKKELASLTVVDLGAGGGDWAAACRWLCARANINVRVRCVDHDPRAVRFLQNRFVNEPAIEVIQADVFDQAVWREDADFYFGNHLLHHLSENSIVELLQLCNERARQGFFFNDLYRSGLSSLSFGVIAGLLFHKSLILRDGLTSIKRGFTRREILALAARAGLGSRAHLRNSGIGHLCLGTCL